MALQKDRQFDASGTSCACIAGAAGERDHLHEHRMFLLTAAQYY